MKRLHKGTPYDYSCPAVQDVIKACASYLVSIKEMLSHKQVHKICKQAKITPHHHQNPVEDHNVLQPNFR